MFSAEQSSRLMGMKVFCYDMFLSQSILYTITEKPVHRFLGEEEKHIFNSTSSYLY